MKSYLKFLSRNKIFTAIQFVGLSLSLGFLVMVFSYVWDNYSVSKSNKDYDRIFAVGGSDFVGYTYGVKELIDENIPEVEFATKFSVMLSERSVNYQGKFYPINKQIIACDNNFMKMFPHNFVKGNADLLANKGNAVISVSLYETLKTGDEDIIGKQLFVEGQPYVIAGVFEDNPNTIFIGTDCFINEAGVASLNDYRQQPYGFYGQIQTFYKVVQGAEREVVETKIREILGHHHTVKQSFYRYDEIFFNTEITHCFKRCNRQELTMLLVVGMVLLISAVLNFINLNVALTSKRIKEFAVRRLLGSKKANLIFKYLAESFLFTLVAFVSGILIAHAFGPDLNSLLQSSVKMSISFSFASIFVYLIIILIVSIVVGILPAIIVTEASPLDVVKGGYRFRNKMFFSKIFIVLQNVFSIIFITLAITMEAQMYKMKNQPHNCNIKNLYTIQGWTWDDDWSVLSDKLSDIPGIGKIGKSLCTPGILRTFLTIKNTDDEDVKYLLMYCDKTALDLYDFNYKERFSDIGENTVLYNESGFAASGLTEETVKTADILHLGINGISGVVQDFISTDAASLTGKEYSIICVTDDMNEYPRIGVVMEVTGDRDKVAKDIETAYNEYCMEKYGEYKMPLNIGYIEDNILAGLNNTKALMRLVEIFMIVSILISLLGLIAMSTYFANQKSKSIAINKVFGGTIKSELGKSLREYMFLQLIANIIALPLAIYLCGRYLEQFYYRIELSPWIFVVTCVISVTIALLAVLWQSYKAATENPVKSLKSE